MRAIMGAFDDAACRPPFPSSMGIDPDTELIAMNGRESDGFHEGGAFPWQVKKSCSIT
ncbi:MULTISPECIES: hypothetical protein [Streptomyces]|uniref:hypothetical protein n=1 Tax=Streptomyces TaxID=1883 RepID=UPI0013DEFF66|nr:MULTISPECIES: hypothetical protein [Streptomyces]NYV73443.1 hypothetical protein [Streptomyces sp. UH6]